MSLAINIIISAGIALATFVGAYKYLPLNWLETAQQSHLFGSTITTIAGTDTLSSSRSVINTNFSNLNTDKIEATQTTLNSLTSASSLATIGTITTGVWNGTKITVPFGGTGSSTLSSGQILIGNSTGNIGVVSGYGASGQFLTSNGTGIAPTWQTAAIDQTANYVWTGTHDFVGSTYIKNLFASSTVANPFTINTLAYDFPSTRAATSTVLSEDGNGHLSWEIPPSNRYFFATTTQTISAAGSDTGSTSTPLNIPSGVLAASSTMSATAFVTCSNNGGSCQVDLRSSTGATLSSCSASANTTIAIKFNVQLTSLSAENTFCTTPTNGVNNFSTKTVSLSGAVGLVIFHLAVGAGQISTLTTADFEAQR